MAWGLEYDGVNDYLTIPAGGFLLANQPFEIEWRGTVPSNYARAFGNSAGNTSRLLIFSSSQNVYLTDKDGVSIIFTAPTYTKTDYNTFKFVRDASNNVSFYLNDIFVQTIAGFSGELRPNQLGRHSSSNYSLGAIEFLRFNGNGNDLRHWSATASDHSNTGLQPVLVDISGYPTGGPATGVNFPTDGSAWVDLGGGDTTGTIAVDLPVYTATSTATSTLPLTTANASVNIPVYTATSTATSTLPLTTANASVNIPVYTATSTATSTLPLTTANASFNVAPFTASATATVSAPSSLASATFAIPSYTATATAESTIVLTTANVSFNVAPFDAAILALAGSPPVDADIAFFAPSFTATASATYEAIAHADITVQSPVYDVTAVADYFIPLKQASFSFNVPAFNLSATAIEVEPSTLASALFNIPSFKADLLALSDVPVSTVVIDFTVPPYAISSTAIEALPLTSASVIFALPAYKATLNARTLDYELLSNIIHIINTTNVIKIKD